MQEYIAPLADLIESFERLPGIGRKTAQRLAFHVLSSPREEALVFSEALAKIHNSVTCCSKCQNFSDGELCPVCRNTDRDTSIICVVEAPWDVTAIERIREYRGLYHVLHGLISPMNGIGPENLKIRELLTRVGTEDISEVIMGTNPTVEGEATAMYLSKFLKTMGVTVTRLAYGIPMGGELKYADEVTLLRAMEGRKEL